MLKRVIAAILATMMILTVAVGCKKDKDKDTSSKKKPTSSAVSDNTSSEDDVSSDPIANIESEIEVESEIASPEEEEVYSHPYEWTLNERSNFFRDTEEAKNPAK